MLIGDEVPALNHYTVHAPLGSVLVITVERGAPEPPVEVLGRLAAATGLTVYVVTGTFTVGTRAPLPIGARRLVSEVWRLVERDVISSRSPAADAALDLRDTLREVLGDPDWQP